MTIAYCVTAPPHANGAEEIVVPVSETYSAAGGTLRHKTELHFLADERFLACSRRSI